MPTNVKDWFTAKEIAGLLNVSERTIQRRTKQFETKIEKGLGGKKYLYSFNSLPPIAKSTLLKQHSTEQQLTLTNAEDDLNLYSNLKPWERKYIDFIIPILKASEGLKGKELDAFLVQQKNSCSGKNRSGLSIGNFYKIRNRYEREGLRGVIPGYGKNEGATIIEEESYLFFRDIYLKEKGTSAENCWIATKGEWIRTHAGEIPENFPSPNSFLRLLQQREPESVIAYARKGEAYWNRYYGNFDERIYDGIAPGSVWVGDHMQINTAVFNMLPDSIRADVEKLIRFDKTNKPVFPWITVWCDFVTGKWMGWNLHAEAPNSDHIFAAFLDGVERNDNEIPNEIYIDNGKDYRSKDFSSGRQKKIKVQIDEQRTTSLMSILGIIVHFALPYNPQTKIIERTFDTVQEWLDQGLPGYRGRNTSDRPEALAEQIKRGEILDYAEYSNLIDYFIENVFNEAISNGKNMLGKSRNEAFAEGYKPLRQVSDEALKMMCMRVSDVYTIGRNGVTVNQLFRIYYYSAWMIPLKGKKVYLRRHPKKYQIAYVFEYAGKDIEGRYLGKALLNIMDTAALAKTDLEKHQLRVVEKAKRFEKKYVKEAAKTNPVDPRRYVENLAAGRAAEANNYNRSMKRGNVVVKTSYDELVQQDNEMKKTGTYGFDVSKVENNGKKETKIFTFFSEKEEFEKRNKKGDASDTSPNS
ncbi:MAG: hypothetical protein A2499_04900 [Stygiobacter sp. RIFOXYC12_FULL_38_8]|nr:MAG: hypothetical protein A2299_16270 [Stygiobacter sp. RIFOXYB2_FULL_37_11]OGV13463.1 MAG: hypothetical protein A2237_16965 [Stygiobacter sp. RIFOXYA2_FULL_38_8]OGV14754.1 MAG: hypothetical protein A2440_09650 [Stygiobacter sp. RIFOXYC2_FULL_38_25]OGV22290.1 MAG: hypothetical protein A2499_04900 [Stygiobacter sp. RIFOXYC12_FULL_38_8]OGV79247.1 MAG: hypothetical protein A2X65_02020 [Stygiobacter sp. GWF2_38_21]